MSAALGAYKHIYLARICLRGKAARVCRVKGVGGLHPFGYHRYNCNAVYGFNLKGNIPLLKVGNGYHARNFIGILQSGVHIAVNKGY